MKPALNMVVAKLRGGETPSALEYGALLREAGCEQEQARGMIASYANAIAAHISAEDDLIATLLSFKGKIATN